MEKKSELTRHSRTYYKEMSPSHRVWQTRYIQLQTKQNVILQKPIIAHIFNFYNSSATAFH